MQRGVVFVFVACWALSAPSLADDAKEFRPPGTVSPAEEFSPKAGNSTPTATTPVHNTTTTAPSTTPASNSTTTTASNTTTTTASNTTTTTASNTTTTTTTTTASNTTSTTASNTTTTTTATTTSTTTTTASNTTPTTASNTTTTTTATTTSTTTTTASNTTPTTASNTTTTTTASNTTPTTASNTTPTTASNTTTTTTATTTSTTTASNTTSTTMATTTSTTSATTTTLSTTTPARPAPSPSIPLGTYNLTNPKDKKINCLMAQMGLRIRLETKEANGTFIVQPNKTSPSGSCGETNANLTLSFREGFITFLFNKSVANNTAYVDAVSFNVSLINGANTARTAKNESIHLFAAKIGHSYSCRNESLYMGHGLYLDVSQDRMQAFNVTNNDFGVPDNCPADQPSYRVAIAVGVTLLVLILVVVVAYLLGRKKRTDGYQSL
uniref:CD68 molecule n=1 Tax=Amphiprion percula TaxID=161767 RepID=A0A3P8SRQ4_AMPPE